MKKITITLLVLILLTFSLSVPAYSYINGIPYDYGYDEVTKNLYLSSNVSYDWLETFPDRNWRCYHKVSTTFSVNDPINYYGLFVKYSCRTWASGTFGGLYYQYSNDGVNWYGSRQITSIVSWGTDFMSSTFGTSWYPNSVYKYVRVVEWFCDGGYNLNGYFYNEGNFTVQAKKCLLIADQQTTSTAANNAQNAYNAAIQAKDAANAAKTSADTAASRAQTTINQTWYSGKYGGSPESTADIAGYIRNQQLPGISNKIDNLATTINNMNSADKSAPVVDVQTLSGALATSGSSIQAVVTVSDANDTAFTYSINGGPYSALPSNGVVSLPVTSPGPNAITIRVKDPAGNVGSKTIIIRKL